MADISQLEQKAALDPESLTPEERLQLMQSRRKSLVPGQEESITLDESVTSGKASPPAPEKVRKLRELGLMPETRAIKSTQPADEEAAPTPKIAQLRKLQPGEVGTLESGTEKQVSKQTSMGQGTLAKPEGIDKFWDNYNQKLASLPKEDRSALEAESKRLEQAQQDALNLYKQNQNDTRWMQVAERVGQAMVQLGAAMQGMKSGVDLSGLKFDKADWKAQYDQNMAELNAALSDIKDRRGDLRAQQKEASAREESRRKDYGDVLSKDYEQRQRGYQAQELEKLRGSQRQDITEMQTASREAIAGQRAAGKGGSGDKQAKALDEAANIAKAIAGTKTEKERLKLRDDLAKALGRAGVSDVDIPGEQDINQGGISGFFSKKPEASQAYGQLAKTLSDRAAEARGGQPAQEKAAAATDPTVDSYAKKYNLSYDQAKNVLVKRGYTPKE